jgi:hypothetical protein
MIFRTMLLLDFGETAAEMALPPEQGASQSQVSGRDIIEKPLVDSYITIAMESFPDDFSGTRHARSQ